MPQPSEIAALTRGHYLSRRSLVERVDGLVLAQLAPFDAWYSEALVAEMSAAVGERVSAGQVGIAQMTDGYFARVLGLMLGRPISPLGVGSSMAGSLRSGVSGHSEVYSRLAQEYRYRRSLGLGDSGARGLVELRAAKMAETDMGLAFRDTAHTVMSKHKVERYRRVINSSNACGLCIAASDRIYRVINKTAMHTKCTCSVLPVTHATDPGSQLNNDALAKLYAAAGGTAGSKLRAVRFEIHEHGELGPQLRVAGQHFRGPSEAAA